MIVYLNLMNLCKDLIIQKIIGIRKTVLITGKCCKKINLAFFPTDFRTNRKECNMAWKLILKSNYHCWKSL